jgi:hypothetical protein
MGEKTHEIHANCEINIATRMANQNLRGDVIRIRFPRICGIEQRTTCIQVVKNL